MDLGLTNKVALITGSSRGLGLASARSLAAEGCRVMLTARGAEALATATSELRALAGADAIGSCSGDLSTEDGVSQAIDAAVRQFGGLDILVNNVGLAAARDLLETPDDVWQEAFDQTLCPAIRASRAAVPHMKAPRRRRRSC